MNKNNSLNTVASNVLKKLGCEDATKERIEIVKKLLLTAAIQCEIEFADCLTEKEAICLLLAAKGQTLQESAKLLGVKETTVITHRRNIQQKLECRNITEAAVKGMYFRYIKAKLVEI